MQCFSNGLKFELRNPLNHSGGGSDAEAVAYIRQARDACLLECCLEM